MANKDAPMTSKKENQLLEQIHRGLEVLRLPVAHEKLDEMLADPKDDLTRLEWLWTLLEPQVSRRIEGRIERRIRQARLPARKTFESFDFSFQKELDRDHILDLATLRFMDQGFNILLAGMSGTGKSHIALALGLAACAANRRVRYTTSAGDLSRRFSTSWYRNTPSK